MKKSGVRRTGAIGGAAITLALYCQWLNIPPIVDTSKTVLPSPNGRAALQDAYKQLKESDVVVAAVPLRDIEDSSPVSVATKGYLVASNVTALRECLLALKLPFGRPTHRFGETHMDELDSYEALARLLFLDADVKASAGDFAGAANSDADALLLGARIRCGGELDDAREANEIETAAVARVWPLIARLDQGGAAALEQRLQAIVAQRQPLSDSMEQEKRMFAAEMARTLESKSVFAILTEDIIKNDDSSTYSSTDLSHSLASRLSRAYESHLFQSKRGYYAEYLASLDAYVSAARRPFCAVSGNDHKVDLPSLDGLEVNTFLEDLVHYQEATADTGLLQCALAIQIYRGRHGVNPAGQSVLVTDGELARLPDDPFAPGDRTQFRYLNISPDWFLLYSLGPDGVDDGGRPTGRWKNAPHGEHSLEPRNTGDWVAGENIGSVVDLKGSER